MVYFAISDENDNTLSYILNSYKIEVNEENVVLELKALDFSVVYELRPDTRFRTVDSIKSYLENVMDQVISRGYLLKISEYFSRTYVMIGYETNCDLECGQFTASKLA